jgi:hypothetical protein
MPAFAVVARLAWIAALAVPAAACRETPPAARRFDASPATPPSARGNPNVVPIAGEEFRKLRGQWRGPEVGRTAPWTFSFGDGYVVVVRDPDGEIYEGFGGFHTELGASPDGVIRVPPGSGVIDVDVVNSTTIGYRTRVSLGTYYFRAPAVIDLCASRPGVHVRALSYATSSEAVRCFRLEKVSEVPGRTTLAERPGR